MGFELTVRKTIKTPPDEAFDAFANAGKWSNWFSANTVVDFRKGGRFSNSDGDTGEYLDIVPNRLLTFTWEGSFIGSRVELHFSPLPDERCEVSLRHYLLSSQADIDKMKTCWSWTLASLASFLETGRPLSMTEWKEKEGTR